MKGGGGYGSYGRGWDGSDVGRTSSFMGELLSAVSTRPSLVGGHRVCGHSLGIIVIHGRG